MKKIGIITFHHAKHSYGAFLQAFATLYFLRMNGFEAEIINYENKWEQKEIHFTSNLKTNSFMLINWFARLFIYGTIFDPCRNKKKIDSFYKFVSKKTKYKDLKKTKYEIVIAGSDQIWNPEITNGIDDAFFLAPFEKSKKISYASSVGSTVFSDLEKAKIGPLLNDFASIGVREDFASRELSPLCSKKIQVVCDPTFLLTREEWTNIIETNKCQKTNKNEKYILTYFVGNNFDYYWNRISDIVSTINLPVFNIQSHRKKYKHVDKTIYNILPFELISLIQNADYILTDSFHGTAFSINLNKNFTAVLNNNNPVRVQNLLSIVGLENRIDNGLKTDISFIDYKNVNATIKKYTSLSKCWFIESIKGE